MSDLRAVAVAAEPSARGSLPQSPQLKLRGELPRFRRLGDARERWAPLPGRLPAVWLDDAPEQAARCAGWRGRFQAMPGEDRHGFDPAGRRRCARPAWLTA